MGAGVVCPWKVDGGHVGPLHHPLRKDWASARLVPEAGVWPQLNEMQSAWRVPKAPALLGRHLPPPLATVGTLAARPRHEAVLDRDRSVTPSELRGDSRHPAPAALWPTTTHEIVKPPSRARSSVLPVKG